MISVVNEDQVFVFDEIGWGDTRFNPHILAERIVSEYFSTIQAIEFFSRHNIICIRTTIPNDFDPFGWNSSGFRDYWFRDIDAALLNFLSGVPSFRRAVSHFFKLGGFKAFSTEQFPLLAAVLLGDNSEH